jgi:Mg/Co/Ni transporter MgtE
MLEGGTNVAALAAGDDNHRQQHQQMTFWQSLTDRAGWLIGLLMLQSLSSFILARNESLLIRYPVIIQFLTMLVGAGGNAGNQASVGVVRGIAVGTVTRSNARKMLRKEFAMGLALSIILGFVGFVRAKVFLVPWLETIAITASLMMIVMISVVVGATLPLCMQYVGIDPAHSSTTIQVIMDITGVVIMVHVSTLMLDSNFHDWLAIALSLDGETR